MNKKWINASKHDTNNQMPAHNHEKPLSSSTGGKERDSLTPAKDKSPDDLEIY